MAIARRRLNERVEENWDDAEIIGLLNEAIKQVQKKIVAIDAHAFLGIKTATTVVGQEFYEAPVDMWYEFEVGYKSTASGSYTRLGRGNYFVMREGGTDATPGYERMGQFFAIWPNPTAAVAAGIRILYMPTLTVGDEDADVLPVHPALHMAIPVWATMMAIGETMESNTELAKELSFYLGDISEWYHRGGDPVVLRLKANRVRA